MLCIATFVICISFMNYIGGLGLTNRKEMIHKRLNELISPSGWCYLYRLS